MGFHSDFQIGIAHHQVLVAQLMPYIILHITFFGKVDLTAVKLPGFGSGPVRALFQ